MHVRILVSETEVGKHAESEQLRMLYRSAKIIIQGSEGVKAIQLQDGREAFFAGSLVGMRTSKDEMTACTIASGSLEELIRTRSIEECQEVLEGRFLLVVVGPEDVCKVCADRYGRKDLYYQMVGERNVFASDLSLLFGSPAHNGFDQAGLAHTLTVYGFRPPKRHTFYRGVRRLGIREVVHIEGAQVEFAEVPFQPEHTAEYGERELNQYADLLLDAVRVRGSRYGNVVYLSSGWDSSSILACLVHLFGPHKVRAAIIRMLYSERSGVINQFEIDRAQAIADYFGIHLTILDLDERHEVPPELGKFLPVLKSHHAPSLTCLSHGILADFVARTTNGDEAVFAGEISDGAHNLGFAQFTTIFHPVLEFREYSDKMASYLFGPTFFRSFQNGRFIEDPVYNLLRGRVGEAIFDEPADEAPSNRTRQLLASFFLRAKRLPLWSLRNSKMLTAEGSAEYSKEMESTYLCHAAEAATQDTLYAWYLHLYNSFHWQSSPVGTLSLTAEANGFHLALPFWDSRLQEFLSAMPEAWGRGLDLNPTKHPLKWMLRNRIDYPIHLQVGPHSYLYDVEPSFTLAGEVMYGSALVPYFKKMLRARAYHDVLSSEMFDLAYIDGLVDSYFKGYEMRGAQFDDLVAICLLSVAGWYGN